MRCMKRWWQLPDDCTNDSSSPTAKTEVHICTIPKAQKKERNNASFAHFATNVRSRAQEVFPPFSFEWHPKRVNYSELESSPLGHHTPAVIVFRRVAIKAAFGIYIWKPELSPNSIDIVSYPKPSC
ncbi:hypothetical protein H6P81_010351 [Aristolochia fimbriata]|uniref:Uncharacterized protein n=1 Tax=Aristolochia fimbriata TaxID=158543 RepID=A0AAV7ERE9_ARIFI|nr:hypothetical protein H6P81_010351 [Aristolochia fimbriata]